MDRGILADAERLPVDKGLALALCLLDRHDRLCCVTCNRRILHILLARRQLCRSRCRPCHMIKTARDR